jgi:hypothetical protein
MTLSSRKKRMDGEDVAELRSPCKRAAAIGKTREQILQSSGVAGASGPGVAARAHEINPPIGASRQVIIPKKVIQNRSRAVCAMRAR